MSVFFISMLLNISFLSFLASVLCRIRMFRDVFFEEKRSAVQNIILIIIFSLMSIFATYIGTPYHGAILNARMIGVLSSGLLGGPLVGIPTAIIAGTHRFFYDPQGLTSLACAFSTLAEGAIGSLLSVKLMRDKMRWYNIILLSVLTEIMQMLLILLIAKPYEAAVEVVQIIALPMIIMNTAGELVFMETFKQILDEDSNVAALRVTKRENEKRLLARAEFLNLQSQVNPHFLYNSLNTISYYCSQKPEEAKKMLMKLADYYRYSAQETDDLVELGSEIDHVGTYLELEKNRFEDRLKVEISIDEAVDLSVKVPSLIIQPIVENAIKHGRDYEGKCSVRIEVFKENDDIIIRVKDEGEGFPMEIIKGLESDSIPAQNVGLRNVNKRLKLFAGVGLDIKNESQGSSVTMTIQSKKMGELVI